MDKHVKKIPEAEKSIKVFGQGCMDDCEIWVEVSGQNYYPSGGMIPSCYTRKCTGYYTYTPFWSEWF